MTKQTFNIRENGFLKETISFFSRTNTSETAKRLQKILERRYKKLVSVNPVLNMQMDKKTANNLNAWAIATDPRNPPKTELSITKQLALKIYALLSDGNFWKTGDIAKHCDRKQNQVRSILQAIKKPWNIESSRSRTNGGYKINFTLGDRQL